MDVHIIMLEGLMVGTKEGVKLERRLSMILETECQDYS